MLIDKITDIEAVDLHNGDDIIKTGKRILIDEKECDTTYRMRLFTVKPGGHTPWHSHDWEHQNYFLRGRGILVTEEGEKDIQPDMFGFIAPGEKHQFKNPYDQPFEFLCLIPR